MRENAGEGGRSAAGPAGAALVIALLVMAALLVLGTTFLTISSTETEIARNAQEAVQAFYVAEAGLARLKRDLLALCASLDGYPGMAVGTLRGGGPVGFATLGLEANSSGACPGQTALSPAESEPWRVVPYGGEAPGGTYQVEVRRVTADTIEAQVTASTNTATRASRQILARLRVDRFGPGEHAVFAEGVWPLWWWWWGGGRRNLTVGGPVFVRGWSTTYPALQLGYGDVQDRVVNSYQEMDPALRAALPAPPTQVNSATGEPEATLGATLRAYQGPIQMHSTAASLGEPAVAGNGTKETLDGVYTNQGFSGAGSSQVYADSGAMGRFDLPREMVSFPDLRTSYTGAPLGGGADPSSHEAYLRDLGRGDVLVIDSSLAIDGTTGPLSYPAGLTDLTACTGPCLVYKPAEGGAPPRLLVNGIVWVKGDIMLGGSGPSRLPSIRYETTYRDAPAEKRRGGTLYASRGTAEWWWGKIEITSDLLPPAGLPAPGEDPAGAPGKFPGDHRLGLIASYWMGIGDWATLLEGATPPTLRIAASLFSNYSVENYVPAQIAGSLTTRYFYLWQGAGIYYVPALQGSRPPGVPGFTSGRAGSPYFVRTLSWRDILP